MDKNEDLKDNLNLEVEDESKDMDEPSIDEQIEAEASKKGWKPQEEWKGNPKDWRSAKEFLDRESFFKKIEGQNKTIRELERSLKTLAAIQGQVAVNARNQAIQELKQKKKEAFEQQDFDALENIDSQLDDLKGQFQVSHVESKEYSGYTPPTPEEFEEFQNRNPWFKADDDLREAAEGIAIKFIQEKLNNKEAVNASDVYEHVEKKVEKLIAKKDISQRKQGDGVLKQGNVRSNQNMTQKKHKYTVADLTQEEREIGKRIVESGAFKNMQEYIDSYVELDKQDNIHRRFS